MVIYLNMNKKIIRTIAYILLSVVMLAGLAGCATWDNFYNTFINTNTEEKPVIKIAVFEPLSGKDAKAAAEEVAGIQLAHEKFGSVLDMDVELVYVDTKSDIEEAKLAAQQLAESDVSMVLGSYGNTITIAAGDIFKEAKLPAIAITCSNPLITLTNPYYARVCHLDTDEAEAAAAFTCNWLKPENVVALSLKNSEYSQAFAETYAKKYKELSGTDTVMISFEPGITDYAALFEGIAITGQETIYLPVDVETARIMLNQSAELGYNFKWIGTSALDGAGISNIYYMADYTPDEAQTSITTYFNQAYAAKYGKDKTPSEDAALGFDAYLLALAAMREADSFEDGELIAQKFTTIKGLSGATGTITMDEHGNPAKTIVVYLIEDGVTNTVYTVDPQL